MGLFNLKKSKTKDDEFEASDAWLMGLADDEDFEGMPGPNASIPSGMASLAPRDEDAFGIPAVDGELLAADSAALGYDDASGSHDATDAATQDLLDSENVDLSSWHFPDLAGEMGGNASDVALSPVSPAPIPPVLASAPADPPAPLFDDRHVGAQAFEPFGDDALVHEAILEDDQPADDLLEGEATSFLTKPPSAEGMGFGSELFASTLDDDIHDARLDESTPDAADESPLEESMLGTSPIDASLVEHAADPHVSEHSPGALDTTAPRSREADLLCEILGVEPGATWTELRAAHSAAMSEYDPRLESDEDRIALAWAIRREMNSTYATLRLLSAA